MENEKSKYPVRLRNGRLWFAAFCVAVSMIPVCGMLLIAQLFWTGYVKTSLDAELVPTAEYLLKNPILKSWQEVGEVNLSVREQEVCIGFREDIEAPYDLNQIYIWTEIFINQQRVGYSDFTDRALLYSLPGAVSFCVDAPLEPGLHLVQIVVKDYPIGLPMILTHTWAIEVLETDEKQTEMN